MEFVAEKKAYIKWNELFYYLFLLIMTMAKGTGLYEGMRPYDICLMLSGICIFIKIISEKYNVYELTATAVLIFISLMVYRSTGDQAALIYTAAIVGMKNIPLKRVFLLEGCTWGILFLFRSFLGMSGIFRGMALVHEKLGLGPIIRWSFGYPHPNVLQITYAVLAALILYIFNYNGKKLYRLLIILFIGNCVVFLYSVSYTGFILTSGLLLVFLYFSIRGKRSKLENVLIQCVLPVCVLFSIGLPLAMEKDKALHGLDVFMNKLFNTRFLASRVYLYEGVRLFGQDVSQINFALDCSYVYLLIKGGILFFLFFFLGYLILIRHYLKLDRKRELAIIISFLIAGVSEPFLFNTSFKNITIFFLGKYLFDILESRQGSDVGIGRKKVGIVDLNQKGLYIPVHPIIDAMSYIKQLYKRKRKFFYAAGIAGAIVIMAAYAVFRPIPQNIYVAAGNTDCGQREEFYFTDDILKDPTCRVYEYQGVQNPMYQFAGRTVQIEIVRDELSCMILGSIAGVSVLLIILLCVYRRKKEGGI